MLLNNSGLGFTGGCSDEQSPVFLSCRLADSFNQLWRNLSFTLIDLLQLPIPGPSEAARISPSSLPDQAFLPLKRESVFQNPFSRNSLIQQEIAGYRDVLGIIHESFDSIPITQNYILQLHKILYSYMNNPVAGRTKTVQNYISATYPDGHTETLFTPLAPYETPDALDRLCAEYNRVIGNLELEPLIAIPVFIHDFLCIHPFNDGNGRMSRLLTTLLLYRSGFYVGKYISLEAKIAKNKDLYYDALSASQDGWHEGTDDPVPFIKYLLGTILAAYRDFEDRFALVETKRSALETVRLATQNKIGRFTKQDIRELCPSLSVSSVEGALRKLVASGELKREGSGKSTCYYRTK